MRRRAITVVCALALLSAPVDAFSLKTPVKHAGHALKVVAKKTGEYALYGLAIFVAVEFCLHGGCD